MRRFGPYILVVLAGLTVSSLLEPPRRADDVASVARETGVRALGAARGYASMALWLRAGEAYNRGDLYETLTTYQLIRELQPRNPAVYSYLAWNQAYNIAPQFKETDRRAEWVRRGFETLRQGQRALPADASLLMDEWSFVLNRAVGLPGPVLDIELAAWREDEKQWAFLVEHAAALRGKLSAADSAALEQFLEETGLQPDMRDPADPAQIAAFTALPESVQDILLLWDWCRFHLMALILTPAQRIEHRSWTVDVCLLNSLKYAVESCPKELKPLFEPRYRRGVETAFANGIDNAARHGGDALRAEFVAHMRENFSGLPGWLPGH